MTDPYTYRQRRPPTDNESKVLPWLITAAALVVGVAFGELGIALLVVLAVWSTYAFGGWRQ